jgi:hypothetical protein
VGYGACARAGESEMVRVGGAEIGIGQRNLKGLWCVGCKVRNLLYFAMSEIYLSSPQDPETKVSPNHRGSTVS